MIDFDAIREANKKRLLGYPDGSKDLTPWTKSDALNPEICWKIISMCVRYATVTNANGKPRQTKKLKFPELCPEVVVGKWVPRTKGAKHESIERTNIETMRDMYQFRNDMNKKTSNESDNSYIEYFKSVIEVLDTYATQVVGDMITADDDFLNRVNAARGCKPVEDAEK